MRIFSRYVFRQAAGALTLILLSLSGVVWIALALRQLNLVTSQGQDTLVFLQMTTLALPNLMALIAPIALLITTLHTLNRLNGDSELIVFTASGATPWAVGRPLLVLALIVSIAVSLVNHAVMPWSLRLLRDFVIQVRTDLLTQVIQPGRFTSPEDRLTFHIRDRTFEGELQGILMNDTRDPKVSMSYLAERGHIVKQGEAAYLVMETGHILRRAAPDEAAQIIVFERYAVDLDRFEKKDGDVVELKPRERYFDELVNPDPEDPVYKRTPGQFRAELHERLSNPLYPFAFVLLAVAFVGQAQSTRQNRMGSLVTGFVVAAGCRLAGLAVNNLVVLRPQAVILLYAIPICAILFSLVMIQRGNRQRGGPTLGERLADRVAALVAIVRRRRADATPNAVAGGAGGQL